MNTNIKICSALLLSLGMSSTYAGMKLPLGNGSIDGTVNKTAIISLAPLINQPIYYSINCDFTDKNGSQKPVIIKFDVSGLAIGMLPNYSFDTITNLTGQAELSDASSHRFTANTINGNGLQQDAAVTITWLASDDVTTPTSYNCFATPSVGKK